MRCIFASMVCWAGAEPSTWTPLGALAKGLAVTRRGGVGGCGRAEQLAALQPFGRGDVSAAAGGPSRGPPGYWRSRSGSGDCLIRWRVANQVGRRMWVDVRPRSTGFAQVWPAGFRPKEPSDSRTIRRYDRGSTSDQPQLPGQVEHGPLSLRPDRPRASTRVSTSANAPRPSARSSATAIGLPQMLQVIFRPPLADHRDRPGTPATRTPGSTARGPRPPRRTRPRFPRGSWPGRRASHPCK